MHGVGELDEKEYIEKEMKLVMGFISSQTLEINDWYKLLQMLIREAYRNGYEHAKKIKEENGIGNN